MGGFPNKMICGQGLLQAIGRETSGYLGKMASLLLRGIPEIVAITLPSMALEQSKQQGTK